MKVSNRIYFSKIWVTIATKLHHTPFYIRPNNLPPGIFWNTTSGSRTWHRWLNDGKILKKSIGAFSRKLRVKFQGVKIQQKQSCFKCYCQLCPQDLTKWYSGLKMNLKTYYLKWNSRRNRSGWLSETMAWISTGVGCCFAFYQKLPLKFLNWAGIKNHSNFF